MDEIFVNVMVVFFNFVKDVLNIYVDGMIIFFYEFIDLVGCIVVKGVVNNEVVMKINFNGLKVGFYIVKVEIKYGMVQKQIVIE